MTAQNPRSVYALSEDQDFRVLRSEFIDEFVRLEMAAARAVEKLDISKASKGSCLNERLKKLAKATPSPRLSRKNASALATIADDCERYQRLRASMVHGIMEPGVRSGHRVVMFRNAADVSICEPTYHVLSATEFMEAIEEIRRLHGRISECTKASSPPQPAPGGAGGP
jgi:hypothetical protein